MIAQRKRIAIDWWKALHPHSLPNRGDMLLGTGPKPITEDGVWPDAINNGTVRDQQGGKANQFDGVDGRITIAHSSDLTFGDGTTDQPFSFLFRFTLITLGITQFVFGKGGGVNNREYIIWVDSANKLNFSLYDLTSGNSIRSRLDTALTTGVEYIGVLTYNATETETGINARVWAEGIELSGSQDQLETGTYVAMHGASEAQEIGSSPTESAFFDGKIYDVRVLNKVVTAGEITTYITNPEDAIGSEVGWWRLDDNGMVDVLTLIHDSDFQSGVGVPAYTELNMTVAGNIDAIADVNGLSKDNVLRGFADATDGEHNHITPVLLTVGKKYNLDIWTLIVTGSTGTVTGYEILNGSVVLVSRQKVNGIWDRTQVQFTATATTVTIRSMVDATTTYIGANLITDDLTYIHEVEINEVVETADAVPTIALDSSVNNNHGFPSGGVSLVSQDIVSWQDEIGYNEGFNPTSTAEVNLPINGFTEYEIVMIKGAAENQRFYILDGSNENSDSGYRIILNLNENISFNPVNSGAQGSTIMQTDNALYSGTEPVVFKVVRSPAGVWSFFIDNVLIPEGSINIGTNNLLDLTHSTFTHLVAGPNATATYFISTQVNSTTIKFSDWVLVSGTIKKLFAPTRDGVNDVYGIPLAFKGVVQKPTKFVNSNCWTGNGVDDDIGFGNIGNITSISLWIKLDADNQTILSLANTAVTEIEVLAGVLTFGASLTESNITIGAISKSAAEAGALLNDNLFHELAFDLVEIAATDFRIASANAVFGSIRIAKLQVNAGVLVNASSAEGAGDTIYDKSGNGNHSTITSTDLPAVWGNTQDVFANNVANGCSLYEHATLDKMYVPYGADGQPLTITPQTGYTKTSDNPSGAWYNGSENPLQLNLKDDPKISRLFQTYGWSSARLVDLMIDALADPWYINNLDKNRQKNLVLYDSLRDFNQASQIIKVNRLMSETEVIALSPSLYVEAFDEDSVTLAGADVTNWDDKGAEDNDPVQADTAKDPLYTTNVNKQLNKVGFNGSSEFLSSGDVASLSGLAAFEIFAVVKQKSSAAALNTIIGKGIGSAGQREWLIGIDSNDNIKLTIADESLAQVDDLIGISVLNTTDFYLLHGRWDGANMVIELNGDNDGIRSSTVVIEDLTDEVKIGVDETATPRYGDIDVKNIVITPANLTAYNRKRIQERIMALTRINKYNI